MIILNLLQHLTRSKLLMVVHEHIGTGYHLPVQFSPHRFSPAGIGNGKVQTVFMQIVPVTSGRDMSKRVSKVVRHHFRFAGSSRSKVHQRDILIRIYLFRTDKRSGLLYAFAKILEPLRNARTGAHHLLHGGRFGQRIFNVLQNNFLACRNNHLNACRIATVYNVFLCQQMCSGNSHSPQLMQSNNGIPKLIPAFQDQHHHISFSYPQALEIGSRPVCIFFQIRIGILAMFAFIIRPQKSLFIRLFCRPCVNHIISKIKVLRYFDMEVLDKILLRSKSCLC